MNSGKAPETDINFVLRNGSVCLTSRNMSLTNMWNLTHLPIARLEEIQVHVHREHICEFNSIQKWSPLEEDLSMWQSQCKCSCTPFTGSPFRSATALYHQKEAGGTHDPSNGGPIVGEKGYHCFIQWRCSSTPISFTRGVMSICLSKYIGSHTQVLILSIQVQVTSYKFGGIRYNFARNLGQKCNFILF